MAKKTLLAIVQDILNDMDGDEVNSITDTTESQQVAQIVQTTYEEIIANRYWPTASTLVQLTASGDSNKPNFMQIPETVQDLKWIRYNKRTSTDTDDKYSEVFYLYPDQFIDFLNARKDSESNVTQISDDSGIELNVLNDRGPTYYTSFDDEWLVFDSYDSDVDTTLQSSKTQCLAYVEPTFTQSDTFIPDLPAKAFPYLISEAKSVAFNALKQVPNAKEEQRSRRQRGKLAREKNRTTDGIRTTKSYGRSSKK